MADNGDGILSHPEILPPEKIVDILSSRGIPSKELVDKDKNDLVRLFYRFVVPLPQRATNMRRANRLRKNLTPIVEKTSGTSAQERDCCSRGEKRKNESSDVTKTRTTLESSNFLHECSQPLSNNCPTTECTNKIVKLSMNCGMKGVSKPVKLNRTILSNDSKQSNSDPTILNCGRQSKPVEMCKQASNKNIPVQCSKVEDTQHTRKKFKRITVTWP